MFCLSVEYIQLLVGTCKCYTVGCVHVKHPYLPLNCFTFSVHLVDGVPVDCMHAVLEGAESGCFTTHFSSSVASLPPLYYHRHALLVISKHVILLREIDEDWKSRADLECNPLVYLPW